MPSFSPAKPNDNPSDLEPFNFFQTTEQLNKSKPAKKKKRKNESAVVEQPSQETVDELVAEDRHLHSQERADALDPNLAKNHHPFQISAKSPKTLASPVFAALGDAFRDRSLTFDTPEEEHEQESKNVLTAPQREDLLDNYISSSPPSRTQPVPGFAEVRGGFSHHSPPPTSPRLAFRQTSRRPSGYQYQSEPLASPPRGRPLSMPSHMFHLPSPSNFNLNQLRGLSNDLPGNASRSTSRKGGRFDYIALDILSSAGDHLCSSMENALLVARQRSLYIYDLHKEEAIRVGKIEGLRGLVVSAKILPSPSRKGSLHLVRPLVVVIVHGPETTGEDLSRPSSRQSDQSFDPSYPHDARNMAGVAKYQTSVEIYSLKEHRHITTLFATRSEEAKVENVFGKTSYEPPGPIGSLSVHVTDSHIAIVSNESGEIYLFDTNSGRSGQPFRCIGKTWTSVSAKHSRTYSNSSVPETEPSREGSAVPQAYEAPLLALHGRVLAYVPPIASSRSTIFGRVKIPDTATSTPGLRSHTASSQPQATCQLETPLDGSKVNEIARGVTQEMLKGAKWVGDQGVQAWKNYWTPKSPDSNAHTEQATHAYQFPPTHALDDPNRQAQQPTIVSFLDLEKLGEFQAQKPELALSPAASFILPGGCSFLSLSSSGVALFTASDRGDVQNVWDIAQVIHPREPVILASPTKEDHPPVIRQIARFTRVTTANVVDISWLGPRGTKLAILTDRGTVHLHDLPHSAFIWPPRDIVHRPSPKVENEDYVSQSSTPKGWSSAFNAVGSSAQTISAAVRTNPLAQFSNFSFAEASAGAGVKGSRIVAAGFSRSLEAASDTVSTIMSIGETRLHIPGSSRSVLPGSARWWYDEEDEAIAVVGDGIIRVHEVVMKKEAKRGKRKYSVVGERIADLAIADIPTKHDVDWDNTNDGLVITGDWLTSIQTRNYSIPRLIMDALSVAELEISSLSDAIHADYRTEFDSYIERQCNADDKLISRSFGESILTEPLDVAVHRYPGPEHEPTLEQSLVLQPEEDMAFLVDQIEEALPISESPPKRKTKKSKATKSRIASSPPWPEDED
ncbi:MAG: hypothetical protein GOMPHAMPRED_001195 [Gomphillus americanus]|uniref:Uncharacterized protein n=1 Tax=Gomphillus americanus TaxID=1940652 RepID=A0A8H3F740_9LECA|nr:MAG: hypothetical protein GOMPHAMPRED_001195 [Gomphillus americanus]